MLHYTHLRQSNNAEESTIHQDTVDVIANLANATVADRESIAALTSTVARLTVEVAAVTEKLVLALTENKRLAAAATPRPGSRGKWRTRIIAGRIAQSAPIQATNVTGVPLTTRPTLLVQTKWDAVPPNGYSVVLKERLQEIMIQLITEIKN